MRITGERRGLVEALARTRFKVAASLGKKRGTPLLVSYPVKLAIFAALYGFFLINWIDLAIVQHNMHDFYSIWIILLYFCPFCSVPPAIFRKDWKLFLALGLLVSLMNDCPYYVAGFVMGFNPTLLTLQRWLYSQFGFDGSGYLWTMNLGSVKIVVTSLLMGVSIYSRIVLTAVLFMWNCRKPDLVGRMLKVA